MSTRDQIISNTATSKKFIIRLNKCKCILTLNMRVMFF